MIKQVKSLRKTNGAKANYIYRLILQGRLKRYIVNNYVAYDTEEYKNYTKTVKWGRPPKKDKE